MPGRHQGRKDRCQRATAQDVAPYPWLRRTLLSTTRQRQQKPACSGAERRSCHSPLPGRHQARKDRSQRATARDVAPYPWLRRTLLSTTRQRQQKPACSGSDDASLPARHQGRNDRSLRTNVQNGARYPRLRRTLLSTTRQGSKKPCSGSDRRFIACKASGAQ